MNTADYLTAINANGVNSLRVEWETTVAPAARYRARSLVKTSSALVMTGVEYKNLAVNGSSETGALPWGEWSQYPYVVTHKGNDYARLYVIDGTIRTEYHVDGYDVDRDLFLSYLTPSQRGAARPNGGTITVKMSNVQRIGAPALS